MSHINTNSKHKISNTVDKVGHRTGRQRRNWIIGVAVFLLIGAAAGLILFFVPVPDADDESSDPAGDSSSASPAGTELTASSMKISRGPLPPAGKEWPPLTATKVQYPGVNMGSGGPNGGPSTKKGVLGQAQVGITTLAGKAGKWVDGVWVATDPARKVVDNAVIKPAGKVIVGAANTVVTDTAPARKVVDNAVIKPAGKVIVGAANTVVTAIVPDDQAAIKKRDEDAAAAKQKAAAAAAAAKQLAVQQAAAAKQKAAVAAQEAAAVKQKAAAAAAAAAHQAAVAKQRAAAAAAAARQRAAAAAQAASNAAAAAAAAARQRVAAAAQAASNAAALEAKKVAWTLSHPFGPAYPG